jgi:hypothetical protein
LTSQTRSKLTQVVVGSDVGFVEGRLLGVKEGAFDRFVGIIEGVRDGSNDGFVVGSLLVGISEGALDGEITGIVLGMNVGISEGRNVGNTTPHCFCFVFAL